MSGSTPIAERERIVALDLLRGVALLGILVMNIQAFAMPFEAYTNPASYGSLTGLNGGIWTLSHLLADLKFMAIFSMLFGAGVVLFSERAEARGGRSAGLYYRRMGALLIFGLAHGYLLFHGDILVPYALCGLWVYLMRRRRPRTLLIVAAGLMLVPTLLTLFVHSVYPGLPPEEQLQFGDGWLPTAAQLQANLEGMRGGLLTQIQTRAPMTLMLETFVFGAYFMWRISALMLLGMALFRSGFITGAWSRRRYLLFALVGIPVGSALTAWGVGQHFTHDWHFAWSRYAGTLPNYWGSLAVALGYIALIMLWSQSQATAGLRARLAAAGRMAFTNYVAQSVIALLIFNVAGFYGELTRWQQAALLPPIWALQLFWSPWWLARYRLGPLEWLWRAATYGRFSVLAR